MQPQGWQGEGPGPLVSAAAETWLCNMSSLMRETWMFYAWKQPLSLAFAFVSQPMTGCRLQSVL